MRASFASLPGELVARIARMVHDQDRAWAALDLHRGCEATPADDCGERERDEDEEDVTLGRWAAWYGKGILALAQVSRATRTAAVRYLYETISARATDAAFFRFDVLNQPLGHLVRKLDCRLFRDADVAVSLACALRDLPNLSSITVDEGYLVFLMGSEFRAATSTVELLKVAFQSALGRITSLLVESASPHTFLWMLSHVDKSRLRRMVIKAPANLCPLTDELVAAIEGLDALVEVELGASLRVRREQLQERLRLPHVRVLTVACGHEPRDPTYEDMLMFAHAVAPSVEALTIPDFRLRAGVLGYDCPRPLLPHLRVLRIDTFDMVDPMHLHLGHLSALTHLSISASALDPFFSLERALRSLPRTIRTLTVSYQDLAPRPVPPALLAHCAQLDKQYQQRWRPSALCWHRPAQPYLGAPAGTTGSHGTEQAVEALERLLEWTRDRARWLLRVGDGRALEELGEAAYRLRERFVVEHM
ncbi:hypothetical protein JCM9279_003351 [Rhodotorula babjevae]